MRVLALPEVEAAKIVFDTDPRFDDAYFEFCAANSDLRIECNSQGEIIIAPPAGGESSFRSLEVAGELRAYVKRSRAGRAFDSSVEFILPSGAAYAPDASWVSNNKLAQLNKSQLRSSCGSYPNSLSK